MFAILEARREVRRHAGEWAAEAIDTYGAGAEVVLRSAQRGYGYAEQYAFCQVRKAIRQRLNSPSRMAAIRAFMVEVVVKGPTIGAGRA